MIYELKNDYLKVGVNTFGAELEYIVKDNINRLWERNDIWPKQSPTLFPMVCGTRNGEYFYKNKKYLMKDIHGFAPKSEFELYNKTNDTIELILKDNKDTLLIYPFKFNFIVSYTIKENTIKTNWKIINTDNKEILFNVGGHPGFRFDCNDNMTYKDYTVVFDEEIDYEVYKLVNKEIEQLVSYNQKLKEINITELIKKHHTVIFKGVSNATMKCVDKSIRIDTTTPYLTFWHNDSNQFLCIEPWCGLPEEIKYDQNIENKYGVIKLDVNKEYNNGYIITID